MKTRHTFTATIVVALLAIAGVTAAIAADPPPPRIAFVANGRVPADALAAGPTAGQLGAPIYTTEQDSLPEATSDALDAYNPELVIVLGGSVAISDAVVNAISAATGLAVEDPSPPPATGVVRAAGADRFATAAVIGELLGAYNLAALPADGKAVDSDLLDGMDSTAFLGTTEKAADSDLLDGVDAADLRFISIPITGMLAENGAFVQDANGVNNGIVFPEANGVAALNFTLPPDYTPGGEIHIRSNWHTPNTSCDISLQHNLLSVARPGQAPDGSQGDVIGNETLNAPATSNIVGTVEAQIPAAVDLIDLAPGTSITLGLFRNGGAPSDTCTGNLYLDGVYIIY